MQFVVFAMLLTTLFFTDNAIAQIALRASSTATTTNTTVTITKPANLAVGDVMIAQIMQSGNDGSAFNDATSSGWTFVAGSNMNPSGNNRYRGTILYKIATATDVAAASFAFALDGDSDDGQGGISAFSGVDIAGGVNENGAAGGPFDVDPGNAYNNISSDSQLNANGINTSTANAAVIFFGMMADNTNGGNVAASNPSSWSELYDEDFNASQDSGIISSWGTRTTAGATGNASSNLGATTTNGALLIALRRFTGTISTGTVTGPICAGSNISVPYTITGTYATGNVFTAQLSNAAGSFASPTAIGTATATTAGSVSATIPAGQGAGSNYKIRVVSNFPPATGSDNGTNLAIVVSPTAAAGSAFNACISNTSINIGTGATASNNSGVNWTSNGTGTVNNPTSLTGATYTPGIGEAATVTFTLTASGNSPCGNATSNKVMTFFQQPTAVGGGSATICVGQTHVVSGVTSSNGAISWSENGAGSITANGTTTSPTYTPAAGDAGNTVTLTMTVANSPCTSATASYTIHVNAAATASAGSALSTCANSGSVNISSTATAGNYSAVLWTSSGTGIFTNDNSLNSAAYEPSAADVLAGSVTLTLTASGNAPCGNVTSNKVLTINPVPVASSVAVCAGAPSVPMTSATVCPSGSAVTSGPNLAGGGANLTGIGNTAWAAGNLNNIVSNNNSYATVVLPNSSAISNYLRSTGHGFSIPANANIAGIQVSMGKFASNTIGITRVRDNNVRLVKAGAAVGSNKANAGTDWPTSEAVSSYGGVADLWGAAWNAADINNADFGVAVSLLNATGAGQSYTASIDYIQIAVTYSVPGELNWYTQVSGGSPIGTGSSFDPVGVAGSGLADTNTPGMTTYYVECATIAGCRTAVDYVIHALPVVSFDGLAASYCEDAAAVILEGNHAGGIFSGAGITDNGDGTASFNPSAAAVGPHQITYTYTDGNNCPNSAIQSVTILQNVTYYQDADNDGFGNAAAPQVSCNGIPSGYVTDNTDCNDNDNSVHAMFSFYADNDGDGFGAGSLVSLCAVDANTPPAGYSTNGTDCDDNNIAIHQTFDFYADNDGDSYGAGSLVSVCAVDANTPPAGYSLDGTDCDDNNNAIHETFLFYTDGDGDGYGAGVQVSACAIDANTPPAGYSLNNTDCDDANGAIFQSGTLYVDVDGDGYTTGATQVVCYGASIPAGYVAANTAIDCNDSVAAINPGHAEVLYNGVDDNCDGNLDEGNQLTTALLAASCGSTLTSIGSLIGIQTVGGHNITGYRIRVTNGAEVQVIEKSVPHFTMPQFGSYAYATTYSCDIELQRNGVWVGYYGPICQVSTPAILAEGGAASVSPSQCGGTLPTINSLIATTSIQGVTGYRFRITNLTDPLGPQAVQTIDRTQNWFSLQMLTRYNYGTTYRIEVSVKTTGGFGGFGAPCEVSSPLSPSLINCNATIAAMDTRVAATSVSGATQYRFQIVRVSDNASATIDRNVNYFYFSSIPPAAFSPGVLYAVRCAVMTKGTWSPFGDACEITSPGAVARGVFESNASAKAVEVETTFSATAYPNPFTSDFNIGVTTSASENVQLKVYDMMGKLIESKEIKVSELDMAKVGAQYPSGVYNVIVSQDDVVRTLRVIKR